MISEVIDYLKAEKKKTLGSDGLETVALFYLEQKHLGLTDNYSGTGNFQEEEYFAYLGYINSPELEKTEVHESLKSVLGKQEIKPGMHYSSNPLLLAGLLLAAQKTNNLVIVKKLTDQVIEKIKTFNFFDQFLLTSCCEEAVTVFQEDITKERIQSLLALYILKENSANNIACTKMDLKDRIINQLGNITTIGKLSFGDIFLFEYFIQNELKQSFIFKEYDAKAIILGVLSNFSDAVAKITKDRRKDHNIFVINDEYDVQDLLYVILKPIFTDLTPEDYTVKHAGSNKRIDLVIPSEDIVIEVKILGKDDVEGKFIEELNVDVSSYYKYPNMKYLLGFVYDPFHKIVNPNNFYQLNGKYSHDKIHYEVEIIINPH